MRNLPDASKRQFDGGAVSDALKARRRRGRDGGNGGDDEKTGARGCARGRLYYDVTVFLWGESAAVR